jgi:hypothetical protein
MEVEQLMQTKERHMGQLFVPSGVTRGFREGLGHRSKEGGPMMTGDDVVVVVRLERLTRA